MKRLLALLTVLILGLSACSGTGSDEYAAKVNGTEISTGDVLDELELITSNEKYAELLDQQLAGFGGGPGLQPGGDNTVAASYTAQIVFNRIIVELIEEDVKRNNVQVTPKQLRKAESDVREDFKQQPEDPTNPPANFDPYQIYNELPNTYRSYLVDRLAKLSALLERQATPELQRKYYDENQAQFTEYCVRHILVESQTQASQLRKQIVDDGGDFAALARANSPDNRSAQSSASQGGSLGCVSATDLESFVPEFAQATLRLPVNQVSEPVKTSFGYHLIQVTAKNTQSFQAAQPQIQQSLANVNEYLDGMLKGAKIEVNPRFGSYDPGNPLQGSGPGVNPPAVNAVTPKSSTTTIDPSMLQQYQQQLESQQAPPQ